MSRLGLRRSRSRAYTFIFALICPCFVSACVDYQSAVNAETSLQTTSCSDPLLLTYHARANVAELNAAEKRDLVMSATGLIPSSETGESCSGDQGVEIYTLSHPNKTAASMTQHARFEKLKGSAPQKTLEQSLLAEKTKDLIRDGQCEQAWNYLTPLVVAGSSEAAGVLWAASANVFSTGDVGENNGILATGMEEFGVTGRGLELSLANASQPSGPNGIYTGIDDIRARAGRFLNIQLEDFTDKSGCDFQSPSFDCRTRAASEGPIELLETYYEFLTETNDTVSITCNRRP